MNLLLIFRICWKGLRFNTKLLLFMLLSFWFYPNYCLSLLLLGYEFSFPLHSSQQQLHIVLWCLECFRPAEDLLLSSASIFRSFTKSSLFFLQALYNYQAFSKDDSLFPLSFHDMLMPFFVSFNKYLKHLKTHYNILTFL
jgi:hypothetical protein